ncbi:MAG: hypothetical protein ABR915_16500 [Thermoguttaceae bacterium]
MHPSQMHYFPVTPLFMLLFLAAFAVVVALVEFGLVTYASEKMGSAAATSPAAWAACWAPTSSICARLQTSGARSLPSEARGSPKAFS